MIPIIFSIRNMRMCVESSNKHQGVSCWTTATAATAGKGMKSRINRRFPPPAPIYVWKLEHQVLCWCMTAGTTRVSWWWIVVWPLASGLWSLVHGRFSWFTNMANGRHDGWTNRQVSWFMAAGPLGLLGVSAWWSSISSSMFGCWNTGAHHGASWQELEHQVSSSSWCNAGVWLGWNFIGPHHSVIWLELEY